MSTGIVRDTKTRRLLIVVDAENGGLPFLLDFGKLIAEAKHRYQATSIAKRFYSPPLRGRRPYALRRNAARNGFKVCETPANADGDILYDVSTLAISYDVLLLVSADNGFADLLDKLRRMGKMINVWSPTERPSIALQKSCIDGGEYLSIHSIRTVVEKATVDREK
ncbi:MAG: NYN domain-containing protein [Pirellulales bacterium]